MEKTHVRIVFRHEKSKNYSDPVTAVFADGEARERGYRSCYSHVGQHSSCNRAWFTSNTRPATPEEYAPLLAELERVGYAVTVVTRVNWSAPNVA